MIREGTTICAPATGLGGAISIIRISGPQSISICNEIFFPSGNHLKPVDLKGYTISYGEIKKGDKTIDDVLLSVFRSPHSYTGEDSAEISCHASPYIRQEIIKLLIDKGVLMAQPGEFTQRAFFNRKMDLSQAEAVADLIASESELAHRIAFNQMRGNFSDEISFLRADLLNFVSLIELELDFGEEDIEFADRQELIETVQKVIRKSEELASSFSLGNVIKSGVPVVIVGRPNSGKSTLLNRLLKEDKALVSEIPGTTRDAIEDTIVIGGIQYRFIDTAGIRETGDIIENLGIRKAEEKIEKAEIILLLIDINDHESEIHGIINKLRLVSGSDKKLLILMNKIDDDTQNAFSNLKDKTLSGINDTILFISAKTGEGCDQLINEMARVIDKKGLNNDNIIVSNIRHYEALYNVSDSLGRVLKGLEDHIKEDLIAIDLRQAIHYLGEITGEITTDEILGNIFKNFCIGK